MASSGNTWCKKLMTKAKAQGIAQSMGTCKRRSDARVMLKGEQETDRSFKFPPMLAPRATKNKGETRAQKIARLRSLRG